MGKYLVKVESMDMNEVMDKRYQDGIQHGMRRMEGKRMDVGKIAWKKHLRKLAVKRNAADKLARKTRRRQYQAK